MSFNPDQLPPEVESPSLPEEPQDPTLQDEPAPPAGAFTEDDYRKVWDEVLNGYGLPEPPDVEGERRKNWFTITNLHSILDPKTGISQDYLNNKISTVKTVLSMLSESTTAEDITMWQQQLAHITTHDTYLKTKSHYVANQLIPKDWEPNRREYLREVIAQDIYETLKRFLDDTKAIKLDKKVGRINSLVDMIQGLTPEFMLDPRNSDRLLKLAGNLSTNLGALLTEMSGSRADGRFVAPSKSNGSTYIENGQEIHPSE